MNWFLLFVASVVTACVCANRCDVLDVRTGRRDDLSYGSNRGWYWPWSPLAGVSMALALFSIFLMLVKGDT